MFGEKDMAVKPEKAERAINVDEILQAAAELIINEKEVSISLLAEKTKKSRVSIHNLFGKGQKESATTTIYRRIVDNFLERTMGLAANFFFALGPTASPIDRLVVVFRAVLVAFRENPLFGKVVAAYHFDLKDNEILEQLFKHADALFSEAREQKMLAEHSAHLEDAQLRSIMFHIICGLLTGVNLDDDQKPDRLTLREVEIEVLRIFKIYCSDESATKIQQSIQALWENTEK